MRTHARTRRYYFVLFNDLLLYAKRPAASSLYKLHKRFDERPLRARCTRVAP